MWVIVHALSGMALGRVLPSSLWIMVPAVLVAHALLDLVPHWDYTHSRGKILWGLLDAAAAAASLLVAALVFHLPGLVIVAGIVSALPDLDVLDALFPIKRRSRWFPSHWQRYPHGHARPLPGVAVQAAVVALSVAVIVVA
jgi:hypothetical protein